MLGSLVNLACIGGVELIKKQQGFELMLEGLRSDVYAVRYYAVAGLQNACAKDNACAWRVVQTNSEAKAKIEARLKKRKTDRKMGTGQGAGLPGSAN